MARTFISRKGQATVPVEFRREWKSDEILWEKCEDGSVRVRPVPAVMAVSGAAKSALPRDPQEKRRAREGMGRGDKAT